MCRTFHIAGFVIASAVTLSASVANANDYCGWQERGSLDPGGATQALTVGDKVYLFGNGAFEEPSQLVRAYDPVSATWEARAPMPAAMNAFGLAELSEKIYRIGGNIDGTTVASADVYDPASDEWAPIADLPVPSEYVGVAVLDSKIYAIGGLSSSSEALDSVYAYDPAADEWAAVAPLHTGRLGHASVTVNGKIYAIGGQDDDVALLASVEAYDPVTDTWSFVSDMPQATAAFASVAYDGRIYVMGGGAGHISFTTLSSFLRFDPMTNGWVALAPMQSPTLMLGAAVFGNELLTFGGLSSAVDGLPLDGISAFPLAAKEGLLSRSFEEPEGENCPAGGTRVELGFDTSCNGELDDEDEPSVIYVCRGEDGAEAGEVLIESREEPSGENCPRGGTRVDAGNDIDGDGKLSSDETTTTTFVCDGRFGPKGALGEDGRDGRRGRSGSAGGGCSVTRVSAGGTGFVTSGAALLMLAWARRRAKPGDSKGR